MLVTHIKGITESSYVITRTDSKPDIVLGYGCKVCYYNISDVKLPFCYNEVYLLKNKTLNDISLNAFNKRAVVSNGDLVLLGFETKTVLYGIIVEQDKIYTDYRPLMSIYETQFIVLKSLVAEEEKAKINLLKKYQSHINIDNIKVYKDILGRKINIGDKVFCKYPDFYHSCFGIVDNSCSLVLKSGKLVRLSSEYKGYNLFRWGLGYNSAFPCYKIDDELFNNCTNFYSIKEYKCPSDSKDIFSKDLSQGDLVIIDYNSRKVDYGILISHNTYLIDTGSIINSKMVIKRDKNNFTENEKQIYTSLLERYNKYMYCVVQRFDKTSPKQLGDVYLLKDTKHYCIYLGKYTFVKAPYSDYETPLSYNQEFELFLCLNINKLKDKKFLSQIEKGQCSLFDIIKYVKSQGLLKVSNDIVEPRNLKVNLDKKILNKWSHVNISDIGSDMSLYFEDKNVLFTYIRV